MVKLKIAYKVRTNLEFRFIIMQGVLWFIVCLEVNLSVLIVFYWSGFCHSHGFHGKGHKLCVLVLFLNAI